MPETKVGNNLCYFSQSSNQALSVLIQWKLFLKEGPVEIHLKVQ